MKTILSIDFDFFVRENPVWDYGHSENQKMFLEQIWRVRYLSVLLEKECDPKKYADFMPEQLIQEIKKKGFVLDKKTRIVVADSHLFAFPECFCIGKCAVYNLDAHHDMYPEGEDINCGNWLRKGIERGFVKYVHWIRPGWDKEFTEPCDVDWWKNDPKYAKHIGVSYYNEFSLKEPVKVDTVFLCRSSAWVPPHLDSEFEKLVKSFSSNGYDVWFAQDIPTRGKVDFKKVKAERAIWLRHQESFLKQIKEKK